MQTMKHFALALLTLSFSTAALAAHHSSYPSSADVSAWQAEQAAIRAADAQLPAARQAEIARDNAAWQAALLQKNQHNAGINH